MGKANVETYKGLRFYQRRNSSGSLILEGLLAGKKERSRIEIQLRFYPISYEKPEAK